MSTSFSLVHLLQGLFTFTTFYGRCCVSYTVYVCMFVLSEVLFLFIYHFRVYILYIVYMLVVFLLSKIYGAFFSSILHFINSQKMHFQDKEPLSVNAPRWYGYEVPSSFTPLPALISSAPPLGTSSLLSLTPEFLNFY